MNMYSYSVNAGWWLGSPLVLVGIVACLGMILWILLARSSLRNGGDMERPERVPQLYGYSVCLVAIVVALVSLSTIVDKGFTLANPLASGSPFGWGGASMTSFEAYRATYEQSRLPMMTGAQATTPAAKPTDAELRASYDALRADRLAHTTFDARRELTTSILLLLIAAALFSWHWRWVRGAEARSIARTPAAA